MMQASLTAAVLSGALIAAGAQAEPPIGSRLGERLKTGNVSTDGSAVRSAHRLARCQYSRTPDQVRGVLTSLSATDQERFSRAISRNLRCNSVVITDNAIVEGMSIETSRDVKRGMLAEAALSAIREDDALQPGDPQASYTRDWFAITGRDPVVDEMAVCVADQNPAGIRALLATDAETAGELAAARALTPSLGPCLPQGSKLSANRQSLRAALAEALYHRATAPALATSK